ncbi:hypothetical protein V2J09_006657 [Rumex salicifolius]
MHRYDFGEIIIRMRVEKHNPRRVGSNLLCDKFSNPASLYTPLSNFTALFRPEVKEQLGYCIKDVDKEWNKAFNFSTDLEFMRSCMEKQKEVNFYFNNFFSTGRVNANYLKPNKNCNLTSWLPGCEPGWACSAGKQNVDMEDRDNVPTRTQACQPCCAGFFCPKGITCMMPCPLGAYCPQAKLNTTTGTCTPYAYQIPPGKNNHSCGGADIWSDITNGDEADHIVLLQLKNLIAPKGTFVDWAQQWNYVSIPLLDSKDDNFPH